MSGRMGRTVRWIGIGISAVALGWGGWMALAGRPRAEALSALRSDARVEVVAEETGVYRFSPMSQQGMLPIGLVFFPEETVDVRAYAPLMRAVAAAGYPVTLVTLPHRGFFASDIPDALHTALGAVHEDERAAHWVIGGHGYGASIALKMVAEAAAMGGRVFAGVLLMGTVHPSTGNFTGLRLPVTKVLGTRDGIARAGAAEANRALLPATTRWVVLDGANHSQFGAYGFQLGDRPASISRAAQQQQTVNAVLETLRLAADIFPVVPK